MSMVGRATHQLLYYTAHILLAYIIIPVRYTYMSAVTDARVMQYYVDAARDNIV